MAACSVDRESGSLRSWLVLRVVGGWVVEELPWRFKGGEVGDGVLWWRWFWKGVGGVRDGVYM